MRPDSPQSDISINFFTLVVTQAEKECKAEEKTGQRSPEMGTEQIFIEKPTYSVVHTRLKPGDGEAQSRASTTWKHPFIYVQVRRNLTICFNHQLE